MAFALKCIVETATKCPDTAIPVPLQCEGRRGLLLGYLRFKCCFWCVCYFYKFIILNTLVSLHFFKNWSNLIFEVNSVVYSKLDKESVKFNINVDNNHEEIINENTILKEMIEKDMRLVEYAKSAMEKAGVVPKVSPIRGGTDGARLSYEGLLSPNLCTGSEGHHGRNEFACVEDMDKIVEIIKNIILSWSNLN